MPKPSVGRIVHLQHKNEQTGELEPQAAIITKVHSDDCVNLSVHFAWGTISPYNSVRLTEVPEQNCCNWPPRVD